MIENSKDTMESRVITGQDMAEEKSAGKMEKKPQTAEQEKLTEKEAFGNKEALRSEEASEEKEVLGSAKKPQTAESKTAESKTAEPKAVEPKEADKRKGKSVKGRVLAFTLLGMLLLALSCVYVGGIFHYRTRFLPGTSVNQVDVSELDRTQACAALENQLRGYSLEVVGRDVNTTQSGTVLGKLSADDIALTYSANEITVEGLLQQQERLLWPYVILSGQKRELTTSQVVSYDREQLLSVLESWDACRAESMTVPTNAYISGYSEQLGGYGIIPETLGTELDMESVIRVTEEAVAKQLTTLDIEAAGCYREAAVTSEDAKLVEIVEAANRMLGAQITYDWNGTEVILAGDTLREWVSIEKDRAVLDEDAVKAFVKQQAESYDTYGKPRSFLTTLGIELTLPSGYYGWQTDREAESKELAALIREGSVTKKEPVYSSRAKKKGMSDIGSSYVEADLTHQHLYLYEDGKIVFETDFVSGDMSSDPGCVTPQGVFGLSYKTTNAVLRGANYVTPVSYWMPFYGNYGMHDATWRSEFGGDIYLTNGSHGCLNLPLDSAAVLYQYVSTGFPIICYYYPVDPLTVQENAEAE